MEQPSSARPSGDFSSNPLSSGPIPTFDVHLRILNDSIIAFFQERKRIEEVYVDSLIKLHKKIKAVDAFLDDRVDVSTARGAWAEIRDNIDRESQTRQAFLASLSVDVISPLTTLKETQERTRKRIKEDLKDSGSAYNDFSENGLPRLKARYLKKFVEVEETKRAAAAAPLPPMSPPPSSVEHHINSNPKPTPSVPLRVTSPQPLRALERRPSGSAPSGRNRSPSSNTAFSDLAQQGKKQLNQLRGFLEKSGTVKEGAGREGHALKAVRAKREADDADKEYRNGVHWLETLRLRRAKILESGYRSLEHFIFDSSTLLKQILEKYTDNMIATSTTHTQLSLHARAIVDKINPELDMARISTHINPLLAAAIPDKILYQHGHVGECSDLIFGFSLVDYATAHNLREGDAPKIVQICIQEIDQRGLEAEGIYRVSGRHAVVQVMQHEIERDESKFVLRPKDDIYAVASLLKLYLRELPEPVFRMPLQERLQHTEDRVEHIGNNFRLIRSKLRRLPPVHQATLKAILEHLTRVVALSEKNKMDAKNLAIVFGPVIFGEDDIARGGNDLLALQSFKDTLMEDLILYAPLLYDDDHQHSPQLPATPAGEEPEIYYGSKLTQVTTVPASPINRAGTASPQDFTPRLPSRPPNSIHPSARANPPPSPTKDRMSRTSLDPASAAARPADPSYSPATSTTTLDTEPSYRTSVDSSDNSQPPSARQSIQFPTTSPHLLPLETLPEQ